MPQSRTVSRPMPALLAASARFTPDSAFAIARMRRVTRGSLSSLASLRNTADVRSLRIVSSFMPVPRLRIVTPRESQAGAAGNRSTATRVAHNDRGYNLAKTGHPASLQLVRWLLQRRRRRRRQLEGVVQAEKSRASVTTHSSQHLTHPAGVPVWELVARCLANFCGHAHWTARTCLERVVTEVLGST